MTETTGAPAPFDPNEHAESAALGGYLIDLILKRDDMTQKWVEFLIAVESGLVVAFGFLMRPITAEGKMLAVPHVALTLLPWFGIGTAVVLTYMALWEQDWQGWYVARFNELPFRQTHQAKNGKEPRIFPPYRGKADRAPHDQPMDGYGMTILALGALIVVGWITVLVWIVPSA